MKYTIKNGVLQPAVQIPSPNFNARPTGDIRAVIVHSISLPPNRFGERDKNGDHYVSALFCNRLNPDDHPYFAQIAHLQVSAHLLILRTGSVIQYVNFADRAWHAGQSSYLGCPNCNDYSVGIELEGSDFCAFDERQYQSLAGVVAALFAAYPKTKNHIAGHSDIAPLRKSDPGPYFNWAHFRRLLTQAQKTPT